MQFLGQNIAIIRKAFRRSLTIRMHPRRGIEVICSKMTLQANIEKFLLQKQNWILKNLEIFEQHKNQQIQLVFEPGQELPLFGDLLPLKILASKSRKVSFQLKDQAIYLHWPEHLTGGPSDYAEDLKAMLQKFYRQHAQVYLEERVQTWSQHMSLHPKILRLKNQTTRWGSCSSKGAINLNWRLIAAPMYVIDYIIVHELSHLRHMNHSQAFWQLVGDNIGDYKAAEKWLRDQGRTLDFLI